MKSSTLAIIALLSLTNSFAQTIKVLNTDSVIFYINTEVYTGQWGGHTFDQKHTAITTEAYSWYDGQGNTAKIVAALGEGNYAAKTCDDLVADNNSDWYLPSLEETQLIYSVYNSEQIFPTDWYWTSTDVFNMERTDFFDGDIYALKKWFGTGEGDIYEMQFKNTDWMKFFCIRREWNTNFPSFEIISTNRTNCDQPNGTATLSFSDPAGVYDVYWYAGPDATGDIIHHGASVIGLDIGTYSVVAVHRPSGYISATGVAMINDERVDPSVTLTVEGATITATSSVDGVDYYWFLDGALLSTTISELTPETSGMYTVMVVLDGCIAYASVDFILTATRRDEGDSEPVIYPNPGDGLYHLKGILPGTNVIVRNTLGEIVYTKSVNSINDQLDISDLPPAIYLVSIEKSSHAGVVRVVKK